MYDLLMTIDKNTVILNKGRRLNISSTNLPLKDGLFSGEFYWKARVIYADESRGVLYAEFENYTSTEVEFYQALDLPYAFNQIEFSNIDNKEISRYFKPNPNFFIKIGESCQGFYFEDGVTVDIQITNNCFSLSGNDLYLNAIYKGEEIRFFLGNYSPTLRNDRYIFLKSHVQRVLGKELFDITVMMKNGSLYIQSEDVNKILTLDCNDSTPEKISVDHVHEVVPSEPQLSLVEKQITLPIKISSLDFQDGKVAFSLKFKKYPKSFNVEIPNTYLVHEFNYIKSYFCTALNKKSIMAEIDYRGKVDEFGLAHEIEILAARSSDIDKIDPNIIKEAQKLCCVEHLLAAQKEPLADIKEGLEGVIDKDLLEPAILIDTLIEVLEVVKHAKELKYLASRHLSDFSLKFGRNIGVTSFLFLVKGAHTFFFILEAVDQELATYIWKCPPTNEGLIEKAKEVESLVASFEENKRMKYIQSTPEDFYRINHRYQDGDQGFLDWQNKLSDLLQIS
ncbi:hypothetical protein [Pelobacter seleniigenes]|uniref:hypothetical protein n=1 Tax=Pelobacter seleniigenes TaxID=407188 RepID=UPI0004A6E19B|nr:hypothetical protein [Pelobacter seleniigenes]